MSLITRIQMEGNTQDLFDIFTKQACPITLEDISNDNFDSSWLIVVNQTVYPLIHDECFKSFASEKWSTLLED